MNTNDEYNNHLLDVNAKIFMELILKQSDYEVKEINNPNSSINIKIKQMLEAYVSVFHRGLGKPFLERLENLQCSPEKKIIHYPSLYWTTEDGSETIIKLNKEIASIEAKKLESQLSSYDYMSCLAIDLGETLNKNIKEIMQLHVNQFLERVNNFSELISPLTNNKLIILNALGKSLSEFNDLYKNMEENLKEKGVKLKNYVDINDIFRKSKAEDSVKGILNVIVDQNKRKVNENIAGIRESSQKESPTSKATLS